MSQQLKCWVSALLLVGLAMSALLLAGCAGSSSQSEGGSTTQEASSEFLLPSGKDTEIVEFGKEGSAAERKAASIALMENLEARESGDFGAQCESLSKAAQESVTEKKGAAAVAACRSALVKLAKPLRSTAVYRANHLSGSVAALRVKGAKAYALFHGDDNSDYAMPMVKEGPVWKVGAIVTIILTKGSSG